MMVLRVTEVHMKDVGRGIARIDPRDLQALRKRDWRLDSAHCEAAERLAAVEAACRAPAVRSE
jgi:hypothetical protein